MHEYERYLAELGDSSHQGRNLSDAEQRRTIFLANRYRIHSHNSLFTAQNGHIPRHHFKLALNQMADWLPHEVNILFHTHFPRPSHPSRSQHSDKNPRSHSFEASQSSSRDVLENDVRNSVWPATLTPEQINWAAALNPRERSVVPEVKNQGICGSCWAFTAIASTEASIRLTHGIEPPSLSVQELVDCDVANNRGCYGGNPVLAYDYLMNKFVSSWADYPYTESKGECRRSGLQPRAKIDGFLMISSFDQEILKRFVASGPVSVGICGTDFVFMFYAGGVFDYRDCCITQNHGACSMFISSPFYRNKI